MTERRTSNDTPRTPHRDRLPVGILGSTGAVGQKFVELLVGHPWFELAVVAASDRSAGQRYAEVVEWLSPSAIPHEVADLVVQDTGPDLDCRIVFSALPASEARDLEIAFADAGYVVVSNASAYRMDENVPLIIPEINPDHLTLIERQSSFTGGGCIVTNPNCSTTGLVATLKPLQDVFGLKAVQVTTLQALSGAGYPGVASLDAIGNVVPYIPNEEDKLENEPGKLLGTLGEDGITNCDFAVSAQCNRVPVVDGHLLSVSVALEEAASGEQVAEVLGEYRLPEEVAGLPSVPARLLNVLEHDASPQPRRHVDSGGGMTVSVGRIRSCPVNDVKYVALVHNTVRGAAGGAILNAELLVAKGYLGVNESVTVADLSRE